MGLLMILAAALAGVAAETPRLDGTLSGVVVDGSRTGLPLADVEVVLRVGIDGRFVSVERSRTDREGRFVFTRLPVGTGHIYLAGANWKEVHFPGPRVVLTQDHPSPTIRIAVFDPLTDPNPLIIEEMEVVLRSREGSVEVTETLRIRNPTRQCYVGKPEHAGGGPVTLALGIPASFQHITFEKEAFGRRFAVVRDRLVTGIPWPPGERTLRYTYVVAQRRGVYHWTRHLNLPCRRLRLRVETASPDDVVCSLGKAAKSGPSFVEFASDRPLAGGSELHVTIGSAPVPMIVYGRVAAVGLLASLAATVIGIAWRRRR